MVIYSNIVPLNTKLFTKHLRRHFSKHIRTKNHLKSFSDVSNSHKTSTNLSNRAYFWEFSEWIGEAFWSFPGIAWHGATPSLWEHGANVLIWGLKFGIGEIIWDLEI